MRNVPRVLFMLGLLWVVAEIGCTVPSSPLAAQVTPSPTVTPTTRIAFTATDDNAQFEGTFTVNADGTNLKRLTMQGNQPAWSPNGKQIALRFIAGDRREIWILEQDGSNPRPAVSQEAPPDQAHPLWSPDGKQLAFMGANPQATRPEPKQAIYVVNLENGALIQIPCLALAECTQPSWSPDSKQIVFTSKQLAIRDAPTEIYVADVTGSSKPRLLERDGGDPIWQPNGDLIALRTERERKRGLFLMRPDGTIVRLVVADENAATITWSPDGRRLAFASGVDPSGRGDIYAVNVDGTNLVRLTNTPSLPDSSPTWSPNSDEIAFQSYRDGHIEIYVVNADGTNLRRLIDSPLQQFGPVWSPR